MIENGLDKHRYTLLDYLTACSCLLSIDDPNKSLIGYIKRDGCIRKDKWCTCLIKSVLNWKSTDVIFLFWPLSQKLVSPWLSHPAIISITIQFLTSYASGLTRAEFIFSADNKSEWFAKASQLKRKKTVSVSTSYNYKLHFKVNIHMCVAACHT